MTIHVWYHGACDDGFGSAWAVHRYFKKHKTIQEVRYTPCFYGKPHPPYQEKDVIYMVDFSYPRDVIEKIVETAQVQVIDHHKTAEEALKGLKYALFDMSRSGAVMTWNFFFPETVPLLLRYVQDNDLWQHKMEECKAVVRYIRTMPHSFPAWDILNTEFETDLSGVIDKAKAIEKYFQNQILFNAPIAGKIFMGGELCPVINCNTTFISEMCHYLHETHKTEIAGSYFINKENEVIFSLRSKGNIDVSAIAKNYGGGGHHNAAGFKITLKELHQLLTGDTNV